MKTRNLIFGVLALGLLAAKPFSEQQDDRWKIDVSTRSMETILLEPEVILANPDSFWSNDEAYVLAKGWHKSTGIPLDYKDYYNKWLSYLEEQAQKTPEERRHSEGFVLAEEIQARIPKFMDQSVKLLNSFSPVNDLKFEATVYITHKTLSYDFMQNGHVVCDPMSPFFGGDPDKLLNLLTHECFHISYGFNRRYRQEEPLENSFIYSRLLDGLHNEGMATWVGYCTREFFPVEGDQDYLMLENPAEVERQLGAINQLFSEATTLEQDTLSARAWQIGVMDRGYYVLGAHMSRTIETELGRPALVHTIEMGPRYFITLYNSLVSKEEQVFEFTGC